MDIGSQYQGTRLLRKLTQAQIAYLSQSFASDKQAADWLHNALPRPFRSEEERIRRDLDAALAGQGPGPSARIAGRVLQIREEIQPIEDQLQRTAKRYPGYAIAYPSVFVITQNIDPRHPFDEPLIVSLAGLDPRVPTLIGEVDAVNIASTAGRHRLRPRILGQLSFEQLRHTLGDTLSKASSSASTGPQVLAHTPVEGQPVALPKRLANVPLGFLIGTSEFL